MRLCTCKEVCRRLSPYCYNSPTDLFSSTRHSETLASHEGHYRAVSFRWQVSFQGEMFFQVIDAQGRNWQKGLELSQDEEYPIIKGALIPPLGHSGQYFRGSSSGLHLSFFLSLLPLWNFQLWPRLSQLSSFPLISLEAGSVAADSLSAGNRGALHR